MSRPWGNWTSAVCFFLALPGWAGMGAQDPAGSMERSLRVEMRADGSEVFLDREGVIVGWREGVEAALTEPVIFFRQVPGWPVSLGEVDATPTVGDLDGDGLLEVVVASWDEHLYVFGADGSSRPGWPVDLTRGTGQSPSLADVDGDGGLEIFMSGLEAVLGLDHGGEALPGWPIPGSGFATAGIDDMDRDGALEIIAIDRSGHAFVWNTDGTDRAGWPVDFTFAIAWSNKGPALGDTTGDGRLEVAIPLSVSTIPALYLFDADASSLPGYPLSFRFGLKEGVSMADMDGDGDQELVFQEVDGKYVVDEHGLPLPGWPVALLGAGNSAPAIGDIDGDGRLEMVWGTPGGPAEVFVLRHDGTMQPGWPVSIPSFSINPQVTLGDIDGDGGVDVVVGGFTTSSVRGRVYAWHADGIPLDGFPLPVPDGKSILGSAVTITDLDLDGDVDLLVGTVTGFGGSANGGVYAFDLPAPYDPTTMEWPTRGHDVRHTNRYDPPPRKAEVSVVPPILNLVHPPPLVRVSATAPAGMEALAGELALVQVQGRPVRQAAESGGPVTHGGATQVLLFDGPALAALIRSKLNPVPAEVRLDFAAGERPGIHGFTTIRTR